MKIYNIDQIKDISVLCKRGGTDDRELFSYVQPILEEVEKNGDRALKKFSEKFEGVVIKDLEVKSESRISDELKAAFKVAYCNIEKFHKAQIEKNREVETMPGVKCFRESRAIERVGLYIPGGSAALSSTVLMLAIPAKIAGCKELILCSPPPISAGILYVAKMTGVNRVFQVGGAQAIAAMAYGTETIPKVDKIFGPGNQYVTAAKMLLQSKGIAIDIPAGPSELLVIADDNARPDFVASDLLSQAEHGEDSQVVLLCTDEKKVNEVLKVIEKQIEVLPRKKIAKGALKNSFAVIVSDIDQAIEFSNQYAPEHLILNIRSPRKYINMIENAGSVFLGPYSCESAGDYASGTNHTLPTSAYAKSYSGVSLDSFVKKITFQEISKEGVKNIGPTVETMAESEKLQAHKNAMTIRLNSIK
ncbi:MAG: histidinol dehydrogenase [bacterium]|nr:histidinol dehydrogenase [bacterium]